MATALFNRDLEISGDGRPAGCERCGDGDCADKVGGVSHGLALSYFSSFELSLGRV
jgi:hypothetical protein